MHATRFLLFAATALTSVVQAQSTDDDPTITLPAYLSDLPTIPASIEAALITAVPSSYLTDTDEQCSLLNGEEPDWVKSLPKSLESALTSYASAVKSWSSKHSSELATLSGISDLPTACTGNKGASSTAKNTGASTTGASATGASASGSASGASGASSSTTGKSASGSATGSAASATGSNAAAQPGAPLTAGIAGVMGVLGLALAL